jgi:hypothetical protein
MQAGTRCNKVHVQIYFALQFKKRGSSLIITAKLSKWLFEKREFYLEKKTNIFK